MKPETFNLLSQSQNILLTNKEVENVNNPFEFTKTNTSGKPYVDHHSVASYLLEKNNYITFTDTEEVLFYEDGVWNENGKANIKSDTQKLLENLNKTSITNEVMGHIQRSTFMSRDKFVCPPELILMHNGIFDLDNKEFKDFSPEIFSMNKLPVQFNDKADCDNFKSFLKEIIREEDIPIIQEFFGYCLYKNYHVNKAVMMIGEGSNGKSVLLNVLTEFLGNENISSIPLQDFGGNRFAAASLFGKLANLNNDVSDRALYDTGMFKMLTGNDMVTVERKFEGQFRFRNFAKMIFATNKIPEVKNDDSEGFFRRWIIINFPYKFVDNPKKDNEKKRNIDLIDKLTTENELSGIFNWAIKGLERLLRQGHFSYSKTTEEIEEDYQRKSNSLKSFCMDCVEQDTDNSISKDEFFRYYVEYCKEFNIPIKDKRKVGSELQQHISYVQSSKSGSTRMWKGIKILNFNGIFENIVNEVRDNGDVKTHSTSYFTSKALATIGYDVPNVPTSNLTDEDKILHFLGVEGSTVVDLQNFIMKELKFDEEKTDLIISKMEDIGKIYEFKPGVIRKL